MGANFSVQRIRGQLVQVKKKSKGTAVFQSATGRQIEKELNHAEKLNYPGIQHYMANEWDTMSQQRIQGGAPSNFLLMKNER